MKQAAPQRVNPRSTINLSENARVVRMDTCEEIYRTRSEPEGPISYEQLRVRRPGPSPACA